MLGFRITCRDKDGLGHSFFYAEQTILLYSGFISAFDINTVGLCLIQMMTMIWHKASSFLLALSVVTSSVTSAAPPLVQAPWGALQGIRVKGDGGRKMNAYLAIPYAKPPVGRLRFRKPVPHPGPCNGETFVADNMGPACPQSLLLIGTRKTSEDCLTLDLYTPVDAHKEGPLAVMIFIHGGGFIYGDSYSYRPSKLVVDGRVIVAAIQYRLGTLGFLTTGDGTLPGNAGLQDQNLAIRWVKDNVQAFGGDPQRITLFGESAGSMSVALQMMSPQSKNLFRRGIMQSGAPGNIAFLSEAYNMKTVFRDFAAVFDCKGKRTRKLVKCMKKVSEEEYMNKSIEFSATSAVGGYFYPVIDGEFLPRHINDLLADEQYMKDNGVDDIDLIIGLNNREGSMVLYSNLPEDALRSSAVFHSFLDYCFFMRRLNKNSTVLEKTMEFFYRGADFGANVSQTVDAVVDMYGDCLMNVDILQWAQRLADRPTSPHDAAAARYYLYVFDHDFSFNKAGPIRGSHHGDELILEFDNSHAAELPDDYWFKRFNKTVMAPEEQPLSDKFVQILTSFAKTGNPSPPLRDELGDAGWSQFTKEDQAYLSLSLTPDVLTNLGPYRDRLALWTKLVPQLNHPQTGCP